METINKKYQPKFQIDELRQAIQAEYSQVACNPNHQIHFTSGRKLAERLGYLPETIAFIPNEAIRPFAGVGNPFEMGGLMEGEVILDLGSGGGFDCIYAAILSEGLTQITGIDMTEEMLTKARNNVSEAGYKQIRFIKGYLENLPVQSGSVDLVISNGVINLCPDKHKVYQEIYRVLKPGGRFMIADVMLETAVPEQSKELVHLWANCVAGAITKEEYHEVTSSAGFKNFEIGQGYDVFRDARIAKSAAYFGAKGYNLKGYKI